MKTDYPRIPSQIDLWADYNVRSLISGCILNIRLKEAGICDKYFCEMSEREIDRYLLLIQELSKIMMKKFNS